MSNERMTIALEWEIAFLDWIQNHLRCGFLDLVVPVVTMLAEGGWFWILLTLLGFIPKKTRKYAHVAAIALILCLLCGNVTLKPLIARIRPFDLNPAMRPLLLVSAPTDYSFPSGHTQASFAAATSICFWKRKWGIPALVLATLIGFSRMYLYVHYPTDVLAGVGFGVLYACIGLTIANKLFRGRKPWDGCAAKAAKS